MIFVSLILAFSFPAFAEDENYRFQYIGNEAIYLTGGELIPNESINSNDIPSADLRDGNSQISLLGVTVGDNQIDSIQYVSGTVKSIRLRGSGYAFENAGSKLTANDVTANGQVTNEFIRFSNDAFTLPCTVTNIQLLNEDGTYTNFQFNVTLTKNNESYPITPNTAMTAYIGQAAQVFTWILSQIAVLITFIFGNAFLSVSLILFVCGAIIAFFIRIKTA